MLADSGQRPHPFFCACRMLVGANDTRIQDQPFQIGILQFAKDPLPDSFASPTIKASPDGVPFAEAFGQIAPASTAFPNANHPVNKKSVVRCSHAGIALLARQKILDPFPMFIRNRVATKHGVPSLARENGTRSLPTSPSYCPHGLAACIICKELFKFWIAPKNLELRIGVEVGHRDFAFCAKVVFCLFMKLLRSLPLLLPFSNHLQAKSADYGRLMPTKLPSCSRDRAHRKAPTSGLSKKKPTELIFTRCPSMGRFHVLRRLRRYLPR